ncbi:hypothetical protein ETB97_012186 [Aspergillus alliaceus]|uniref:F-box domain-containing protein n=1 Tax=Petromyces alliaceus TaxID=209559 RepID=A0A8H6A930_PETAA|nr:hypothetical protein ETB97_012186 [Aspergillus burnettii]
MDRLPTEVIQVILHGIPNIQDRLNLVQISRRWRASCLAIAFCSTHLQWSQVQCLVEAALANPVIRYSIREISVEKVAKKVAPERLSSAVQDLIDLISDSPVEWDAWRKQLSNNQDEAWIALLLAVLPNLAAPAVAHCLLLRSQCR